MHGSDSSGSGGGFGGGAAGVEAVVVDCSLCYLLRWLIKDYARQKVKVLQIIGVYRYLMNHGSCSNDGIRDLQPVAEIICFNKFDCFFRDGVVNLNNIIEFYFLFHLGELVLIAHSLKEFHDCDSGQGNFGEPNFVQLRYGLSPAIEGTDKNIRVTKYHVRCSSCAAKQLNGFVQSSLDCPSKCRKVP